MGLWSGFLEQRVEPVAVKCGSHAEKPASPAQWNTFDSEGTMFAAVKRWFADVWNGFADVKRGFDEEKRRFDALQNALLRGEHGSCAEESDSLGA